MAGCAMRIGQGYDVHKLVPDRKLILGGVDIPYEKALLGHSDADVIVHAVMDALLGAAGLWDIGHAFPQAIPLVSVPCCRRAPARCRGSRAAADRAAA